MKRAPHALYILLSTLPCSASPESLKAGSPIPVDGLLMSQGVTWRS